MGDIGSPTHPQMSPTSPLSHKTWEVEEGFEGWSLKESKKKKREGKKRKGGEEKRKKEGRKKRREEERRSKEFDVDRTIKPGRSI